VAILIYILLAAYKGSFSSYPCQQFLFLIFEASHSDWGEMEYQCSFDLHFLVAKKIEYFLIICWPLVSLLLRTVCSVHLPIYLLDYMFF
jgi:hypothetical protein